MAHFSAVAYARYSSDTQQESSIVVQIGAIRKFCAVHNIHLIHEYTDEAQTGTHANRKAFQEMIAEAPKKQFQFVIVHRIDRWARNVDDARYYKRLLRRYGIKVISALEEFDETPEGEFFELMSMGMAELYSKKLSRESIAGKLANARECKAQGGVPPLGYRVVGKKYEIDEKEAEAVRIIFQKVADGESYADVRDFLNANGYRHSDGRIFSWHFTDILRNRKYVGDYIYNKRPSKNEDNKRNSHARRPDSEIVHIPHGFPQIIDEPLFQRVQEKLNLRAGTRRSKKREAHYLLTGLLRCKECGQVVCGNATRTKGYDRKVYRCNSKRGSCICRDINTRYLDEYIMALLLECLLRPENEASLIELVKESYMATHDRLQEDLAKLEELKKELENKKETELQLATEEEAKAIRQSRLQQAQVIQTQISGVESDIHIKKAILDIYPNYEPRIVRRKAKGLLDEWRNPTFENLRALIVKWVHMVQMDNETVEITLNMNEFLGSSVYMPATFLETRDYIARSENHSRQHLTFPELTVSLDLPQEIRVRGSKSTSNIGSERN